MGIVEETASKAKQFKKKPTANLEAQNPQRNCKFSVTRKDQAVAEAHRTWMSSASLKSVYLVSVAAIIFFLFCMI